MINYIDTAVTLMSIWNIQINSFNLFPIMNGTKETETILTKISTFHIGMAIIYFFLFLTKLYLVYISLHTDF